ncbi:MAG: 2,3-bisphosphoglycerate-dependent phosphoglycerate mutase [Oligoflexia bacterium]|nr:2,3-bisphosphoglycerate-dependent phosphoglycerate mutase [Oligoflexia bacterium]
MIYLVLIRHGQSEWNKKNLFTGWTDVGLSEQGKEEAKQTGLNLRNKNIVFEKAFSSALKRAIQTMEIVLQNMSLSIPFTKAWQLNERHYGQLQGKNKQEIINKFGEEQVQKWRRGFITAPPPLTTQQTLSNIELYQTLKEIPQSESLKDTQDRVLPFWSHSIYPCIKDQKSVLITAHGNSLRALIKKLEVLSDEDISSVEVKTGQALIYQLDQQARVLHKESL